MYVPSLQLEAEKKTNGITNQQNRNESAGDSIRSERSAIRVFSSRGAETEKRFFQPVHPANQRSPAGSIPPNRTGMKYQNG